MAELSEITERLQKAVTSTGGLDRPLKIDLKGERRTSTSTERP